MEKIASFQIDHTILTPGMYVSRVDGDITTYDLRFCHPNDEPPMEIDSMHTIEHLAATYLRSSRWGNEVIYFGPMGCRTGFYLLLRSDDRAEALQAVQKTFQWIADYAGEIPGASEAECGNFRSHNLELARQDAANYAKVLRSWSLDKMIYPQNK